jgi:hypothetical protein
MAPFSVITNRAVECRRELALFARGYPFPADHASSASVAWACTNIEKWRSENLTGFEARF